MENSTLRKIVLDELYAIATTPERNIIPEGFDKDPMVMPDGSAAAQMGGSIGAEMQAQTDKVSQQKQAKWKLAQAAMRCGYGKDVEKYKESGWKCKQEDPFDTTAELEAWRTWLQEKHPDDFKKLGISTIESMKSDRDVKMYYKHVTEYAKNQKDKGETTPGVDDEEGGLSVLQLIVLAIVTNKVVSGISGSFIVGGLWALIRRGRRASKKKNKSQKGSQYKAFTNFLRLSTHDIANQIAKEPAAMKAEMQAVAKKSNAELRAGVEQLTDKKLSDRQIQQIKDTLGKDTTILREAIVSARKMAIEDFMKNKGNFTADEVIQLMTKSERVKYEKYVRQLERRRKPKN
jgi:hypothetical protein